MKNKIMEGLEYMDQEYIDEAAAPKARVVPYKPMLRWAAIAACLVLVVGLFLFNGTDNQEIVLPPVRQVEGVHTFGSYAKLYTPRTGFQEARCLPGSGSEIGLVKTGKLQYLRLKSLSAIKEVRLRSKNCTGKWFSKTLIWKKYQMNSAMCICWKT